MKNANENKEYFDCGDFAGDCSVYLCARSVSGNVAMTQKAGALKSNRLAIGLLILALAMFGFGYALIPVYDWICKISGINGKSVKTIDANTAYTVDSNREIAVEFISTVNKPDTLAFSAETAKLQAHPGEYRTVSFQGTNKTDRPLVIRTMPSLSPGMVSEYLKMECFCFTEQTLKPGESRKFPVRFVISPELPDRYAVMTLSLSVFDITEKTVTQNSK